MRRVFDTTHNYKVDTPSRTKPDADKDSQILRTDHELLWSKELPSGDIFAPKVTPRRSQYLIHKDSSEARHCYGSDAITSSYTSWVIQKNPKSRALVDAIEGLNDGQKTRYLKPAYTVGSTMIWPVRAKDPWTMNRARGANMKIADRMDLTLECIRRHYAGEAGTPLTRVTDAYADFFELFIDFKGFVEFFHFQDLVARDCDEVEFYLPFDNFKQSGTPATTTEYVKYREAVLKFIERRSHRMAEWVRTYHPEVEVVE